jgi:hypothetical protein
MFVQPTDREKWFSLFTLAWCSTSAIGHTRPNQHRYYATLVGLLSIWRMKLESKQLERTCTDLSWVLKPSNKNLQNTLPFCNTFICIACVHVSMKSFGFLLWERWMLLYDMNVSLHLTCKFNLKSVWSIFKVQKGNQRKQLLTKTIYRQNMSVYSMCLV